MATAPNFLGDFRKGDRVQFAIDNASGWQAAFYDVFDNQTKLPVLFDVQTVEDTDSEPFLTWVDLELADVFDTEDQRAFTWVEGRTYSIRVKDSEGNPPTDGSSFTAHFRVEPQERRAFLGTVEKGKNLFFMHREENRDQLWYDVVDPSTARAVFANVPLVGPLSGSSQPGGRRFFVGEIESEGTDQLVIGRTYWVRVKDIPAEDPNLDWLYSFTVLPRLEAELRRLLAYAGENMVLDNFSYDQAGNVVGLRVRLFSNSTDADRASAGVTDPEPGEIASLDVSQEHNVPRNVRTFHKSVLDFISSTFPEED